MAGALTASAATSITEGSIDPRMAAAPSAPESMSGPPASDDPLITNLLAWDNYGEPDAPAEPDGAAEPEGAAVGDPPGAGDANEPQAVGHVTSGGVAFIAARAASTLPWISLVIFGVVS